MCTSVQGSKMSGATGEDNSFQNSLSKYIHEESSRLTTSFRWMYETVMSQ